MRTRSSQQDPGKSREKQLIEKVKDLEQLLQDVLQERDQELTELRKVNAQQITQIMDLQKENAELKLLVGRGKVETKSLSSQTDEGGSVVSQAGSHIFYRFMISDLDVISRKP